MKDLVRQRTSLTEEIEQALNEQIKMESHASATYLAMAAWADSHGFQYSAEFFYKQAEEEREHMLKIFKYVVDVGGKAISPNVSNVNHDYDNLKSLFEATLDQEIAVTQSINRIVDKCYKVKDYTTAKFLDWFLQEQIEEEFVARQCLELFEVIGDKGFELFLVDKQVPKIKYQG